MRLSFLLESAFLEGKDISFFPGNDLYAVNILCACYGLNTMIYNILLCLQHHDIYIYILIYYIKYIINILYKYINI